MQKDEILKHVIFIRENISSINEHLRQLNSKVATNVINIDKNRIQNDLIKDDHSKDMLDIKVQIAKYSAITGIILTIILSTIQYLF